MGSTQGKFTWRRLVAGASAAAALLLGLAGPGNGTPVAEAADGDTGVFSSASLRVTADGEFAAGDDSWNGTAALGKDTGATEDEALHNNVVRSNDYITYYVDNNVSTSGDVTLVFNAPTGLVWDPSVTQNCNPSDNYFTDTYNGQIFTCVKTVTGNNVGFPLKVQVVGLGNGAVVPTVTMQAGNLPETSATVSYSDNQQIKVSAIGKANVMMAQTNQLNSVTYKNTSGLSAGFKVLLYVPIDPVSGTKGVEPLASSFTYQIKLPADLAGAVVRTCSAPSLFTTGTGADQLTNPGKYDCKLDAAGTTLTVTVTDADSTVSRWPTITSTNGLTLASDYAAFSSVDIQIFYPLASFPNGRTYYYYQVAGFDPPTVGDGTTKGSNYGPNSGTSGYAPNQQPGAVCLYSSDSYNMIELSTFTLTDPQGNKTTGSVDSPTNCYRAQSNLDVGRPGEGVSVYTPSGSLLPNAATAYDGLGLVTPGAKYRWVATAVNRVNNPELRDVSGCFTWDNTLQQLDTSRSITSGNADSSTVLTSSTVRVEYAAIPFTSDDQRKSFNCGVASSGDGTFNGQTIGWSTTPPADATTVTAVRWTWVDPIAPGGSMSSFSVPMIRTTTPLPPDVTIATDAAGDGKSVIPIFYTTQYTTDTNQSTFAWKASDYDPTAPSNHVYGQRVLANDTEVQVALSWNDVTDAANNKPGTTHTITLTPSMIPDGGLAQNVTIEVQLPNACVTYQGYSAEQAGKPVSVQATAAQDCAGGNTAPGAGQVLTFNLGDLTTADAGGPITFNVNINAAYSYQLPKSLEATATSYTDSDLRTATSCSIPASGNTCTAVRTGYGSLPVAYTADFSVTKTASASKVLAGSPYSYQISWQNHTPNTYGTGVFVDVLPFNNDGRGTTGLGGLQVNSVEVDPASTHNNPGDIHIQYTCDTATTVLGKIADNLSDNTISWADTPGCQSGTKYVSAVRFTTPELTSGTVDIINMTVTPVGLTASGVIVNTVDAKAAAMAEPLYAAARNEVVSGVGSLSGNVFTDLNYNWADDDVTSAASLPAGTMVAIVGGYTFGPDMNDDTANNGGGGDDVALDTSSALQQAVTDGLVPAPVTVNPDGTYSFPAVNPGNYQLQVNLPDGYEVAVLPDISSNDPKTSQPTVDGPVLAQPANDIVVGSGEDVTDVNFGIQKTLALSLQDDDYSGPATQPITVTDPTAGVLKNDTITAADDVWQPPASTVEGDTASVKDGTVSVNSDGTFTYTPPADPVLIGANVDSFTYTVTDVQGHTATATVNITLTVTEPVITPGSATVLLDSSQENPSVTTTITNGLRLDDNATLQGCKVVSVSPNTGQATVVDGATDTSFDVSFTATAVGVYTVTVECEDSFEQSAQADIKVTVVSQAITIQLHGAKAGDKVGDLITWTYTVKNTGTADLTDIAITDSFTRPTDTASAITCPALEDGILKPGDSIECTATSTITQAQKDAGIVLNEANATGLAVVGDSTAPAVADPSQASVKVAQNPKVDIVKNALLADANGDKQANVGEQITFEITLTNLGDVTINNLSVIDTMPMTLTCTDQASGATVPNGKITLAPDPKATVVCKSDPYTITADDLAAGEVVNKATYSGDVGTPGSDKVYGEGNGTTTKINGGSEVTVTVTAPEAPTGGWMANTNWAWAWLFGAGLLVAGGCLLMRRRAQRQAGEAR